MIWCAMQNRENLNEIQQQIQNETNLFGMSEDAFRQTNNRNCFHISDASVVVLLLYLIIMIIIQLTVI